MSIISNTNKHTCAEMNKEAHMGIESDGSPSFPLRSVQNHVTAGDAFAHVKQACHQQKPQSPSEPSTIGRRNNETS